MRLLLLLAFLAEALTVGAAYLKPTPPDVAPPLADAPDDLTIPCSVTDLRLDGLLPGVLLLSAPAKAAVSDVGFVLTGRVAGVAAAVAGLLVVVRRFAAWSRMLLRTAASPGDERPA